MKEEEINLLAKEGQYERAIQILVESEAYEDAENFCLLNQTPQKRLMTTLFGVYVRHYQEANEEKRKLAERHQASINKHLTEEEKE